MFHIGTLCNGHLSVRVYLADWRCISQLPQCKLQLPFERKHSPGRDGGREREREYSLLTVHPTYTEETVQSEKEDHSWQLLVIEQSVAIWGISHQLQKTPPSSPVTREHHSPEHQSCN